MLLAPALAWDFNRGEPSVNSGPERDPVSAVRAILDQPDSALDYAKAKVAVDGLIDPAFDRRAVFDQLDSLAEVARDLTNGDSRPAKKLAALRKLLYEKGSWNGHRPFEYDHVDYQNPRVSLLPNYLATRRGHCVTMPILFLILADRLGLDIALARATCHLFVRCRGENGQITNLETTSGALPARDSWLCETRRVSQRGIETGFYMRSLSRREANGTMALTLVEHLMEQQRFREAIAVSELLVQNDPTNGISLAHQGQAYFRILGTEFLDKYRFAHLIPPYLQDQYERLLRSNHSAFQAAAALGWEPID